MAEGVCVCVCVRVSERDQPTIIVRNGEKRVTVVRVGLANPARCGLHALTLSRMQSGAMGIDHAQSCRSKVDFLPVV